MRLPVCIWFLLLTRGATFDFPDLNSLFGAFQNNPDKLAEIEDVLPKDRVKRQDRGIGDESNIPHIVRSSRLPVIPGTDIINDRYMPTIGNGFLATTVFSDLMYMNGLFNGKDSESHRAGIPALFMGRIRIANDDVNNRAIKKYILNAEEGYFMETIDCDFAYIENKIFIHKHYIRVLVSDIYWRRKSAGLGGGKLLLTYPSFNASDDIVFGTKQPYYAHFHASGRTKISEDGSAGKPVHMFWMDPLTQMAIQGSDSEGNYTVIMAADENEANARSEFDAALRVIESGSNGHYRLFSSHSRAWKNVWKYGKVELIGNNQLAKTAMFAQYYILCSLPSLQASQPIPYSDYLYGVSRASMAKGGKVGKDYQGHVMWDSEMYILPGILLTHPELVKNALRYRSELAGGAKAIAESMGAQGYKYPYRSAYTGKEVSPGDCMECENKKYYVSAAVAWGIRQYFSVTRDQDYLVSDEYNGCDVSREIARFFASRSKYNPETARYDMGTMTGPDDTYPDRKNNAFTLVGASLAIHWARYMACQCQRSEREQVPDEWIQMALYYDLPFDNVKRRHEQFSGFFDIPGARVKQAETIMLTYPFTWNVSRDIMRRDLEFYEGITDDRSPAMTWSFFTIGWKWVGETTKINLFFKKSYEEYLISPFKIWTEYTENSPADQREGTVNFLPGMGGFLQSLVFGFAGIRIRPEMLEFHDPKPPPDCTSIRLVQMNYLGANLTIEIDEFRVTIDVIQEGTYPLSLKRNNTRAGEESLSEGVSITIDNPKEGFFIYTNRDSGCEHPRDYIYMPWGYGFDDNATSARVSTLTLIILVLVSLLFTFWDFHVIL